MRRLSLSCRRTLIALGLMMVSLTALWPDPVLPGGAPEPGLSATPEGLTSSLPQPGRAI